MAPVSRKEFRDIQANIECGFTLKREHDMVKIYSHMQLRDKYSQHSSIIWPVWLNSWVFVYKLSGCGFQSHCSHLNFRYGACFKKGVPWHSDKYECGFTLKHVHDMIKTYSQMYCTDNHSQHNSIIWPVWLNGWVLVYKLSGCGFESCCSQVIDLFN